MCNPTTTDSATINRQTKNEKKPNASAKSKEVQPDPQTQRSCTTFAFAQPHGQTNHVYRVINNHIFAILLH